MTVTRLNFGRSRGLADISKVGSGSSMTERSLLITSGETWPLKDLTPDDGHFLAKPYKVEKL